MYGLRVAVDHDGLDAGLGEAVGGMDATIVELDPLADPVGPAAEDDDFVAIARVGLAFGRAQPIALVARVHVRGQRGKLGGAGVDALIDRVHPEAMPQRGGLLLADAGEAREAGIGKPHLLQPQQPGRIARQPILAHPLLDLDDLANALEEPAVVAAGGVDLLCRKPMPVGLRDQEEPVGRGFGKRRLDRVLDHRWAGAFNALDRHLVKAVEPDVHRAQRLLHRFGEAAADRHGFADRFHRGRQQRLGSREFLERKPRHLGDDIIDRRLERGRGDAGDLVVELVERVADREFGGDFGDRKPGGLRRQGRRARHPGVHLDDDEPAILGVDRELHIRSTGVDADLAQHRDRGVAHQLIFLVGQRQGRRHRHRIAGMHPHRVDILDRADDDAVVVFVAHDFELVLLPAEHRFLDQHLTHRRGAQAAADDFLEFFRVVGDAAAGAAQREGRPDDRRKPDRCQRLDRGIERADEPALWRDEADFVHRLAEQIAVFGLGDGRFAGADQLDPVAREDARAGQRHRRVERGLAAHRRQQCVGALAGDDLLDDVRRDRLDIGGVGQLRVGHDRRRVRIDQHDPVAFGFEGLARLRARIIEFARLSDHDRPGADDQDALDIGALRDDAPPAMSSRRRPGPMAPPGSL